MKTLKDEYKNTSILLYNASEPFYLSRLSENDFLYNSAERIYEKCGPTEYQNLIDETVADVLERAGCYPKNKLYYEYNDKNTWIYMRLMISDYIQLYDSEEFVESVCGKKEGDRWFYTSEQSYVVNKCVNFYNNINKDKFAVYLNNQSINDDYVFGIVLVFDWKEIANSSYTTPAKIEERVKSGLKIKNPYYKTESLKPFTINDIKMALGISNYQIAKETGLSQTTVANAMENFDSLGLKNANAIANALGFANAGDLTTTVEQRNDPLNPDPWK